MADYFGGRRDPRFTVTSKSPSAAYTSETYRSIAGTSSPRLSNCSRISATALSYFRLCFLFNSVQLIPEKYPAMSFLRGSLQQSSKTAMIG